MWQSQLMFHDIDSCSDKNPEFCLNTKPCWKMILFLRLILNNGIEQKWCVKSPRCALTSKDIGPLFCLLTGEHGVRNVGPWRQDSWGGRALRRREPGGPNSLAGAEAALQISCEKELNFFALGSLSPTPASVAQNSITWKWKVAFVRI